MLKHNAKMQPLNKAAAMLTDRLQATPPPAAPAIHHHTPGGNDQLRQQLDRLLTNKLKQPETGNYEAVLLFQRMNRQMMREGISIGREHFEVLVKELVTKESGIMATLAAENPYVMKAGSTGCSPVFYLGKYGVHAPLMWALAAKNSLR